jgi:hypothetical protein
VVRSHDQTGKSFGEAARNISEQKHIKQEARGGGGGEGGELRNSR